MARGITANMILVFFRWFMPKKYKSCEEFQTYTDQILQLYPKNVI